MLQALALAEGPVLIHIFVDACRGGGGPGLELRAIGSVEAGRAFTCFDVA